mgnify:CR=1 FL=1
MNLTELKQEYLQLMAKADQADSRKEAVSIIHRAARVADKIAIIAGKSFP